MAPSRFYSCFVFLYVKSRRCRSKFLRWIFFRKLFCGSWKKPAKIAAIMTLKIFVPHGIFIFHPSNKPGAISFPLWNMYIPWKSLIWLSMALFTVTFAQRHMWRNFGQLCWLISTRNCPTSTWDYIVVQVRKQSVKRALLYDSFNAVNANYVSSHNHNW